MVADCPKFSEAAMEVLLAAVLNLELLSLASLVRNRFQIPHSFEAPSVLARAMIVDNV